MKIEDLREVAADGVSRGLHFIVCSAEIQRQFEFVQNVWVRYHKFGGLYADPDPIIGTHYRQGAVHADEFTVQAEPFRRKYRELPQFTTVKGGGYFFLPGIQAFRYLVELPDPSMPA